MGAIAVTLSARMAPPLHERVSHVLKSLLPAKSTRQLLCLAVLVLASLPSPGQAFERGTTPNAYDAVLPPINEGALLLQGRRYPAIADSDYFIEGRRLNQRKGPLTSGTVETFGVVVEDYWAPMREGYIDATGIKQRPYGSPFSEAKSMKVLQAIDYQAGRYSMVLTRDGRVFLIPWKNCSATPGTTFCGYEWAQQLDDGVGQLTFEMHSIYNTAILLLYVKADRRLIETRLSLTGPQVLGSRTVMTLPPQVHNPKITSIITSSGVEYSACGIDPSLNAYCTGVLKYKQTATYSGSRNDVMERTSGAHFMGSNIVYFVPSRGGILGQAMNTSAQYFLVGSAQFWTVNGATVMDCDLRGLFYQRAVTDLRKPDETFATASRPTLSVSYTASGQPLLYAVGPDRLLYTHGLTPSWGWLSEEGSYLISKPAVAVRRDVPDWYYQGDLFYVGGDRGIYHRRSVGGTNMTTALGGVTLSNPSAVSWGGNRLDVFARGTDNGLWHRGSEDSHNWYGWERVADNVASDPVAVSWGPWRLDIFYRGTDNALWQAWWDGSWHSRSFGGYVVGDPAVVSHTPGNLEVFYRGSDHALWHGWTHGGTNQFGWESFGGYITASPVAVARSPQLIDVFVRGSDGAMWRAAWEGAGWFWVPHGGYIQEGPFTAAATFNRYGVEVYYKGADRNLWRHSWSNGWKAESFGPFE